MNYKLIVALTLLPSLFQTCKTEEPLYSPSIKSISFTGFAPEDVELNQTLRTITIMMPATVTDFSLKSMVELTPNTEIVSGLLPDGTLDLSNYCPCTDVSNRMATGRAAQQIVLRNTNDNGTGAYWLILKAKRILAIKPLASSPTYSISDKSTRGVVVPVENYYGSEAIRKVTIVNIDTGKSAYTSGDGSCLNDCSLVGLNQMSIHLDFFLRNFNYGFGPGLYSIEFSLNNGTIVKTPQAIHVVP